MTDIYFNSPSWLLSLILIPIFLVVIYLSKLLRKKKKVPFSSLTLLKGIENKSSIFSSFVKYLLISLAFIFLILALADLRGTTEIVKSKGTTILLLDVSISMLADDLAPNRLEVMKVHAKELVNNLPEDSRIGLVFFSGTINVISNPIDDKIAILSYIDGIDEDTIDYSTATGDALDAGLKLLINSRDDEANLDEEKVPGVVVLMTDGERTAGQTEAEVLPSFVSNNIKLFTIGIGTNESAEVIYVDPESGLEDVFQISALDDELMSSMAEETGGEYYRADSITSFSNVVDKVNETGLTYTEVEEVNLFYIFIIIASVILLLLLIFFLV